MTVLCSAWYARLVTGTPAARGLYHIAAVARLTGLSADVIRSWERRYGLVRPDRNESGVRQYSVGDVERLTLARRAVERGHPIRRVAELADEDLRSLTADEEPAVQPGSPDEAGPRLVAAVIDALRGGDAEGARRALTSAALLMPPAVLVTAVLVPLMNAVGELWHDGSLAIWEEHLLSEIVRSVAGRLVSPAASAGGGVVLATPPGELHAFGIAFAEMLACARGVRTFNLGTGVPPDEIARAARRLGARCVVVAITRSDHATSATDFLTALDQALPDGVALWAGGPAGAGLAAHIPSARVRGLRSLEEFNAALAMLV